MVKPKWKEFEDLVFKIQKELASDAEVKKNDRIFGQDTKTYRQIDISIRCNIGQYPILIIIDCKDHLAPLDVKDVGEFSSMVHDVQANKGALISSRGFTKSAIESAKTYGIETLRLLDTQNINWKAFASISVLIKRIYLKKYQFRFENFEALPGELISINPLYLKLFDDKGSPLGLVKNIVAAKWNQEQIKHEPGIQNIQVAKGVFIVNNIGKFKTDIIARLLILSEYYFGNLPVSLRGFHNEQTGAITAKSFTTDFINPYKIERGEIKGWRRIADPAKLAVKPTLEISYIDYIPISKVK